MTNEHSAKNDHDIRALTDDELDAVTGGLVATTAHFVNHSFTLATFNPFSPILLPPSPC